MKNAIILHGRPSKDEYYDPASPSLSNAHWLPWMQKQLIINDIVAQTPEIPRSFEPEYDLWQTEFERYDVSPETLLIGHSCGAGFLVRWLSDHKDIKAGKVILVAPWLDPKHELNSGFFDFQIDKELAQRTKKLVILNSDDDGPNIHTSVEILNGSIDGIETRNLQGYGHFTYEYMKTYEFPELLKEALS